MRVFNKYVFSPSSRRRRSKNTIVDKSFRGTWTLSMSIRVLKRTSAFIDASAGELAMIDECGTGAAPLPPFEKGTSIPPPSISLCKVAIIYVRNTPVYRKKSNACENSTEWVFF
jgi:hypothetical protein